MPSLDSKVNFPIRGHIEVFLRYPIYKGWYDRTLYSQKNTIVNSSVDILAKAAVAEELVLNGMYFAFTNGVVSEAPVPPERTANYYQTTGSVSPKGFVRVPTIAEPSFGTSDPVKFAHNRVVVVAVSDTNVVVPDFGNSVTDNVSKFYGAGLLALDPNSFTDDILFSAVNFDSPLTKVANAQIGVRWTLTFNPTEAESSSSSSL